jgi:uncharacterized membrane protein YdjX (TVP38/TMEM64 family)
MDSAVKSNYNKLSLIFLIIIIGGIGIIFGTAFINNCNILFIQNNIRLFQMIFNTIMPVIITLDILFLFIKNKTAYKIMLLGIILISFLAVFLFILESLGFFNKIKSVEELRNYISSFGKYAILIFIIIQFLQVTILPIPALLTVSVGVLLFGPLKAWIFSSIGIILGSILAFYIGKKFGYKVVRWLIGKESLDKTVDFLKGKDKILLTFMFLLPFFPDDILCFVAGLSSMDWKFFLIMIIFTRIISIFASCYSLNNSIIPYNTWWGILIWLIILALVIISTILIYKKGNKIEKFIKNKVLRVKSDNN